MKRMSKATALVLTCAMGFSLMPAGAPADAKKKVTVKKVEVVDSITGSAKTVTVAKGKKVKLSATVKVTPNKAANKKVAYKSKNKKIATVSKKGVVKGVKAGTTKVTVTSKKNKKKKATITVKVVKATVSKVTLNSKATLNNKKTTIKKNKITINAGDKLKLSATVKAGKGAVKTVGWNSSKPKVASVSQKGVVTALKGGNTVITAEAADGSGKKASVKVTVKDSVNLTAVSVVDPQTITFSLSKASSVAQTSVAVSEKAYYEGKYVSTNTIESMSSADNKNYTITLDRYSHISEEHFVQLSIPTLSGKVKTLETQYREPVSAFVEEEVWTAKVDEYFSDSVNFYSSVGSDSVEITGLPAGLAAEKKGGSLYVKGIPTAAGIAVATVTGVDERGNTLTKTIKIVVGSDTQIFAAAATDYVVVGDNYGYQFDKTETEVINNKEESVFYEGYTKNKEESDRISNSIYVAGGSGRGYSYSIAPNGDPAGIVVKEKDANGNIIPDRYKWDDDYDRRFYFAVKQPGDYTVTVRVTDTYDTTRYYDVPVVIKAAAGVSVSGKITDAQGVGMRNVRVGFTDKNKAELYPRSQEAYTDINGNFTAIVYPGIYSVEAVYGGYNGDYRTYVSCDASKAAKFLYNQNYTVATTACNMQLPLYRVHINNIAQTYTSYENGHEVQKPVKTLYSDGQEKDVIMNLNWYINKQEAGYKDYIYLKPGQYTLEAKKSSKYAELNPADNKYYDYSDVYTVSVNVVNADIDAAATIAKDGYKKINTYYAPPVSDSAISVY